MLMFSYWYISVRYSLEILQAIFIFTGFKNNMKIQSKNYSQNFTSNIKFVSGKDFDSRRFRQFFYCGKPKEPFIESFCKGYDVWTPEVRTCTAGGVVDGNNVLAFHLLDKAENIENVKTQFVNTVGNMLTDVKSALILGAKKLRQSENSIPLFEKLKTELKKIVSPSIFETHKNIFAESNIGYESYSDTWFINTIYPKSPQNLYKKDDVLTLDELLNSFKLIKIAPQDRLFVGEKEITPKICPEIFNIN